MYVKWRSGLEVGTSLHNADLDVAKAKANVALQLTTRWESGLLRPKRRQVPLGPTARPSRLMALSTCPAKSALMQKYVSYVDMDSALTISDTQDVKGPRRGTKMSTVVVIMWHDMHSSVVYRAWMPVSVVQLLDVMDS